VQRLLAIGAVAETDDPATGPLDASALPPGAAVTHQLCPATSCRRTRWSGWTRKSDAAIADANAKSIAAQTGGDAADRRQAEGQG
jgi:hypothetical protein